MVTNRLSIVLLLLAGLAPACASAPAYVGLNADELLAYAQARYDEEDWNEAIASLDRLILGAPGFGQLPRARLLLARSYYNKEDYLTAASEFVRLINNHPTHEVVPEAALGVCRAYAALSPIPQRDQSYTEQAIRSCQNVVTDHAGSAFADSAVTVQAEMRGKLAQKDLERGIFYFRRGLLDSALIFFEDVVESYPDTDAAPEALLHIVRTYERFGYEEDAQEARERLLSLYPDSPQARAVANGQ